LEKISANIRAKMVWADAVSAHQNSFAAQIKIAAVPYKKLSKLFPTHLSKVLKTLKDLKFP